MAVERERLVSLYERAGALAAKRGHDILASYVGRLGSVAPLAALEYLSHRGATNSEIRSLVERGRMYWTLPRDRLALAGVGAAAIFDEKGESRFSNTGLRWRAILRDALLEGHTGLTATGPLIMGGFSFKPDESRSETWSGFPDSHLMLPRILVTSLKGQAWITINAFVNSVGRPDTAIGGLVSLAEAVIASPSAGHAQASGAKSSIELSDNQSRRSWDETVERAVDEIRKGSFEKVVIARSVNAAASSDFDVFPVLRHLESVHQDSFVFGYWRGRRVFAGATPERLVRVDGRNVETSSLAGTIARGGNRAEDAANAKALLVSAKDRVEHAAVRDSLQAALAETCDDVTAPKEPSLLTLPNMHHLHTEFRARLREGSSIFDLVERLHPTPAVGGYPRDAALEFICANENLDRGWYAAPIGWSGSESGEFAVGLRSSVISGDGATLFGGCGIVADSDADEEFDESTLKLQVMESALKVALESSEVSALELTSAERSA